MTKNSDISQSFSNIFKLHEQNIMEQINVGEFAKIKSYDESTQTADIITAIEDSDTDGSITINACPVLQNALLKIDSDGNVKQVPFSKGELVFIIFNNRDLDNFEGGPYTKNTNRMHSINDAVVVGRY